MIKLGLISNVNNISFERYFLMYFQIMHVKHSFCKKNISKYCFGITCIRFDEQKCIIQIFVWDFLDLNVGATDDIKIELLLSRIRMGI